MGMVCCSEERVEVSLNLIQMKSFCSTGLIDITQIYLQLLQLDENTRPQDLGLTDYTVNTFGIYNKQMKFVHKQINSRIKFEPLYKGSTDGFTASAFHAKVDNKGPTITFIKTDGNQVIGIY